MASPPHEPPRLPVLAGPSWDDLRIFLAVVAHGSLNAAAKALRQSQPTTARRLRALEEALGVALVLRGPNSLSLTEAGRAVLEAASPMAEAAAAVPRTAAAYRTDPHAPVRITATASVTMFLSQHAPALSRAASPAEVAFLPTRRRLDLAAGEADIALRMAGFRRRRSSWSAASARSPSGSTPTGGAARRGDRPARGRQPVAPGGARGGLREGPHGRGPDRRHADPPSGDPRPARGPPACRAGSATRIPTSCGSPGRRTGSATTCS
jgi:DNA-binding transcriptional LysR family regulator